MQNRANAQDTQVMSTSQIDSVNSFDEFFAGLVRKKGKRALLVGVTQASGLRDF